MTSEFHLPDMVLVELNDLRCHARRSARPRKHMVLNHDNLKLKAPVKAGVIRTATFSHRADYVKTHTTESTSDLYDYEITTKYIPLHIYKSRLPCDASLSVKSTAVPLSH